MATARTWLVPQTRDAFYTNNFDAIRLAMALLVVWSHCYPLHAGNENGEPFIRATNGFISAGKTAVWVFFIVSGFLIANSLDRSRSWRSYLSKRFRRIYPGYLVATMICAFVVTPLFAPPLFHIGPIEVLRTIGGNLLLGNHFPLPDLFVQNPVPAINGALWSIKFEFLCYLGIMAMLLIAPAWRRWTVVIAYLLIVATWCWLDLTGRKPGGGAFVLATIGWPYQWFQVLPNFLIGTIAYLHRDRIPRSTPLLLAGLIACGLILHFVGPTPGRMIAAHILLPPTTAYLVLWLAYHPALRLRHVARYGDFSFGTYLYGYTIQQLLMATATLPFWSFMALSLVLALLAGVASWHLIERHFLRGGDRPAEHRPVGKGARA